MERFIQQVYIFLILSLVTTFSYAIEVKVQTTSKEVTGLGFTVDGKQHGGLGTSYEAKEMPEGKYNFGLRDKDKDIGCHNDKGEESVQLVKNTTATLVYENGKCTLEIQ